MINSVPYLVTEVFGYAFSKVEFEERGKAALKILKETDLKKVFEDKDFSTLKDLKDSSPQKNDYFIGFYKFIEFALKEFAETKSFRDEMSQARSQPHFLHQKSIRKNHRSRN